MKERLKDLAGPAELYPRVASKLRDMTCSAFKQEFKALEYTEQLTHVDAVSLQGIFSTMQPIVLALTLLGRVNAIRVAGSKLVFIDLVQEGQYVQSLCNYRMLSEVGVTIDEFKRFCQTVRRGDILSGSALCYSLQSFITYTLN